ncbi:MAG: hypothetical protein AB203_01870 [Parcubacteria bacterium C7867-008]|nr:MAG: hypothetical protein AB203_01870 [Parcubacteria bacterium C7867-008]
MTDEAPKEEILTGPHDESQPVPEEPKEDAAEVEEISQAIDVASDLVSWTRTPAGKDTIERLQTESRKAMNELFAVLHESPELGRLISVVARFEASVQMMRRFTGAQDDLDTLLDELSRKRPSTSSTLAR